MSDNKSADLLFAAAEAMGLSPERLNKHGLIAVNVKGQERYLSNSFTALNSQLSGSLTRNKHSTRVLLERHGFPNIPYLITSSLTEAQKFLALHGEIVAKPISGAHPKVVILIKNLDGIQKIASELKNYILEKFVAGKEVRYLILNQRVLAIHELRSTELLLLDGADVQRISLPKKDWNAEMVKMSVAIINMLGLHYGVVDYKITPDNEVFVLEVNSCPGIWRFEEPDEGPPVRLASLLIKEQLAKDFGFNHPA